MTIVIVTERSASSASGLLSISVLGRPAGHRALEAASCDVLVDDLALAIAVVLASPPTEPQPPGADEVPTVSNPPAIEQVLTLEHGATWQLGLLGGAATTVRGTGVADIGARVKRGWWSLASVLVHASGEDLSVAPGVVHISRGEVALLPCLHVGRGVACADVAGGWISGSSGGFTSSTTATMPFAATGLRVGWEQPVAGWLAVQVYFEGRVALTANRFFIDDMAVWTDSRLEAWAGIAAVAHIP